MRGFFLWARTGSDFKKTINSAAFEVKFRTHFNSLKSFHDLWVYKGFMMTLNHQAGIQGT